MVEKKGYEFMIYIRENYVYGFYVTRLSQFIFYHFHIPIICTRFTAI